MRPALFNGLALVVAAGAGLYFLKSTIEDRQQHLAALKVDYVADQKALKVLKAEWAYLNSPEYLKELSARYLALKPLAPGEVVLAAAEIPRKSEPALPVTFAYQTPLPDEPAPAASLVAARSGKADEP
jgi:hypothetical protein